MPIAAGDSVTRTRTITDEMIRAFADAVDDHNPVHVDEDYAANTMFKGRIAHGMLVASLISSALANDLPGAGSIYMGQELKFKKPVYIGDTITATVTVRTYNERRRIAVLETIIRNQRDEIVIEGEATVLAPET